jgi:hypothetical protein
MSMTNDICVCQGDHTDNKPQGKPYIHERESHSVSRICGIIYLCADCYETERHSAYNNYIPIEL